MPPDSGITTNESSGLLPNAAESQKNLSNTNIMFLHRRQQVFAAKSPIRAIRPVVSEDSKISLKVSFQRDFAILSRMAEPLRIFHAFNRFYLSLFILREVFHAL